MFKLYYDRTRFSYIDSELMSTGLVQYSGSEKIKKTATLYGKDLNVYIDTSDGVNEDLESNEYCGRVFKIIEETKGKPFLFFKSAFSPVRSLDIVRAAEDNNGTVLPFFKMPFNSNFNSLIGKRDVLIEKSRSTKKGYDIGFYAGTSKYTYPKPSQSNPLISWTDTMFGSDGKDMGFYDNYSRPNLFNKIKDSKFSMEHKMVSYDEYIESSHLCRTIINPPGVGEYTSRMLDHCFLGNCIVIRKTTYDNGYSWKDYIPEVDFETDGWEDEYQNIIDNRLEWGDKAKEYFDLYWTPEALVDYFVEKVEEFI